MSDNGCLIGFPNRIDAATLTGGSFVSTLPLNNLKNRLLGKVARTTDASLPNTTFKVDLGASKAIQLISLVNHNISTEGMWRVRCNDETSTTNYFFRSQDVGAWSILAVNRTMDVALAPDGTMTMDSVVATNVNSEHRVSKAMYGSLGPGTYTASIFVKDNGITNVRFKQGGSEVFEGLYNLTTGVCSATVGNGSVGMTDVGNGVWRLSLTYTTSTQFLHNMFVNLADSTGATTFVGDNISGVYVWGGQCEVGGAATSYYPAGATSSVRPDYYMDNWQQYTYSSGWLDAWPVVYGLFDVEWEDDNYWSGVYTPEQIAGYTPSAVHILPYGVSSQRWVVEINDTTNPAGYIQVGRVFIGPAWSPTYDAEVGLSLGWESNTTSQTALSGTKYFQKRAPYRVTNFTLAVMDTDEALQKAFELDKMAGTDQEVFWVQQKNDTTHALRRRYLGTFRQMSPIEFPYATKAKKAYCIEEIV